MGLAADVLRSIAVGVLDGAGTWLKGKALNLEGEGERLTLGQVIDDSEAEGVVVTSGALELVDEQHPTIEEPELEPEPPLEGSIEARFGGSPKLERELLKR